jgi:hypothetical protein
MWNLNSGEVKWSEEHFRILGVNPDHEKPSRELFWTRVHPEDRPLLEQIVDNAVAPSSASNQRTLSWTKKHFALRAL